MLRQNAGPLRKRLIQPRILKTSSDLAGNCSKVWLRCRDASGFTFTIIQAFSPAIQDLFRNIATAILLPARQPVNFRLGGHRLLPTLFRLPAHFRHPAPSGTRLPGTPAPSLSKIRCGKNATSPKSRKKRPSLHGRKWSGRNRPPRSIGELRKL